MSKGKDKIQTSVRFLTDDGVLWKEGSFTDTGFQWYDHTMVSGVIG